jgi:YjjG family noncanonical pyrimidine nucleotidase
MLFDWFLFDADNTLFDFDYAERTALKNTFRAAGFPFDPQWIPLYHEVNREYWTQFEAGRITTHALRSLRFARFLEKLNQDIDADWFGRTYLQHLSEVHRLVDGAEETIGLLKNRVRLMVITNGLTEVQHARFARSEIIPWFEDVIISGEVGYAKPDARIFDIALQRMGSPDKNRVLLIGDSLSSDIRGGRDYGLPVCWYNPKGVHPDPALRIDYTIGRLEELLPLAGISLV